MQGNRLLDNDVPMRAVLLDNCNGTVTDPETGLMWTRQTCGAALDWFAALAWVEARNADGFLGHDDWRLPNACELKVFHRRFPNSFQPGSALIQTTCPNGSGVDPAQQTLRSATTHGASHDPGLQRGTQAALGSARKLRRSVRGDGDAFVPIAVDPGHPGREASVSPRAIRIYDRVPLVRAAGD